VGVMLCSLPATAQQRLTVAAAADLQQVMPQIVSRFEKECACAVKVAFGSSGNFFAQIQNGAPFDAFFSADDEYPRKIADAGLAVRSSLYQYATGKIVLWVPKQSRVDLSKGLNVVAEPSVTKLAIANPAHAPYGRAAEAALRNAGLWQKVSSKLVLGENISQTASFAETGAADAAIIALSLAITPESKARGSYIEISHNLYPPLRQTCVVLNRSTQKELAGKFIDFLKTGNIRLLLQSYGFSTGDMQ